MFTQYIYILIGFISIIISLVLGIISLRYRRQTRAVIFFSPMMFMVALWQVSAISATLSKGGLFATACVTTYMVGLIFTVPFLMAFTLQYTGHEKWASGWRLTSIFIIPVISAVMMITNPFHHWMAKEIHFAMDGNLLYSDYIIFGWYFWVHSAYSYLVIAIAMALILLMARRSYHFYRQQALLLMLGVIPGITGSLLESFKPLPQMKLDISSFGFVLTGMIFYYAITGRHLLNIVPIARDMLIENMGDGMLVLNEEWQIVDINPAAESLLHVNAKEIIGQPVNDVLAEWQVVLGEYDAGGATKYEEKSVGLERDMKYYDVRFSPILDRRNRVIGELVVLRDITQRKDMEEQLRQSNETLTAQLEEINRLHALLQEQVIRDPLTGLYNRRYLNENLVHEIERAKRKNSPLSILMIDIDHFKEVNDTFGHAIGDKALVALCQQLTSDVRSSDTVYRYGGEEFLIIMLDTSPDIAFERAEMVCRNIEGAQITIGCIIDPVTISIGVASFPFDGQDMWEVIDAADVALYSAKANGRNRVERSGRTQSMRV